MKTRLSRARLTMGAALIAAVSLGLTACGGAPAPSASPTTESTGSPSAEQVSLRVFWWGGDARHERTQKAIEAFEAKYPTIDVTGEFSDWGGYWDKLATSTAGGNAPDVMQMDELYLASYAARDTLVDLGAQSALDTSNLDPGVLGLGTFNGTQYAMPISTTAFGILVNEDLLAKLGVTLPDTDAWTWADLEAFAKSVGEASNGEVYGISPMNNGYSLQLWARQNGEALFTNGAVSITPATLAGYFQLALDWTKSGAAAPASHQAEVAGVPLDQSDIATGKQALTFSQVTQISAYAAAAGDAKFSIVQIPTQDANAATYSYLKPGMYWAVSSSSANTEAAATFVDFMVNSEEAGAIIGTERGIPANPAIRDSIAGSLTDNEKLAVDFVAKVEQKLGTAPEITPNGGSDLDGTISRYLQQVIFEQQTPQQAAEAFIAELQGAIDKAE